MVNILGFGELLHELALEVVILLLAGQNHWDGKTAPAIRKNVI